MSTLTFVVLLTLLPDAESFAVTCVPTAVVPYQTDARASGPRVTDPWPRVYLTDDATGRWVKQDAARFPEQLAFCERALGLPTLRPPQRREP